MTASDQQPKTIAGRYEILEEVGQGGMATVYRGQDLVLGREVAVKLLHAHLARDPEHRRRFRREARTTARLEHPGIVKIFDFSEQESKSSENPRDTRETAPIYLVMEFIEGRTLQQELERQEFPLCELAAALIERIAHALEHAHLQQIIHRDLKPENVLIRGDGMLKITDFGLARILDGESMTRTGTVLGSPAYMAPEQIEGKTGDHRTDLFALGVMLYRLACQKHPFDLSNPMAILKAVCSGQFIDPEVARPGIGRQLAQIIRKAMALEPNERYQDISQMRQALQEYLLEVGISEPKEALRTYLLRSDENCENLRRQIVMHLKKSARSLATQKRYAAALDRCNRVLTLVPDDSDIQSLLKQLSQQKQWGRLAIWTGASAATVALLLVGWWLVSHPSGSEHVQNGVSARYASTTSRSPVRPNIPDAAPPRPTQILAKRASSRSSFALSRTIHTPAPPRRPATPTKSCRFPLQYGAGRLFTLFDTNLAFRIALRKKQQKRQIFLHLVRRPRDVKRKFRAYQGPLLVKIDNTKYVPLRLFKSVRLRVSKKNIHSLRIHLPRIDKLLSCTMYVPRIRPPKPVVPVADNPDVRNIPPTPGPKRRVTIRVYPWAQLLLQADKQGKYITQEWIKLRTFELESGWEWIATFKRDTANISRWKIFIPKDGSAMFKQEVDEYGNGIRPRVPLKRRNGFTGDYELFVKLTPKPASIFIGSSVSDARLLLDGEQVEYLSKKRITHKVQWDWDRWIRTSRQGVTVQVYKENYVPWVRKIRLLPGQTKRIGIVQLQRIQPKVAKP